MTHSHRAAASGVFAVVLAAVPAALLGYGTGADPRLSGAPGDNQGACTRCHTGTSLNQGTGSVRILLPTGNTYTPGVTQRITVQVRDATQRRWGFEASARLASAPSSGQAGTFSTVDGRTQVICDNGRAAPCSNAASIQFVTHTQAGTQTGTTGSASFTFDWRPPSSDLGNVTLYAAGNAANGNNSDSGDRIYTTSVVLTPEAASPRPAISSGSGVVNAASFLPGVSPGAWITITGTDLSSTTRTWTAVELASGALPTSLDGVSVTINGKPAYVQYISPAQINVVAPQDDNLGPVEVRVTSNGQTSEPAIANLHTVSPALFTYDGKYLAATHANNSLLGRPGLFASAPSATTPARPGETVILYGTGFGATNPAATPGTLTTAVSLLAAPITVTIGGLPATVSFAGLVPPFAALYQLNVQVPEAVAAGDHKVVVQTGGAASPESDGCCYVTVER